MCTTLFLLQKNTTNLEEPTSFLRAKTTALATETFHLLQQWSCGKDNFWQVTKWDKFGGKKKPETGKRTWWQKKDVQKPIINKNWKATETWKKETNLLWSYNRWKLKRQQKEKRRRCQQQEKRLKRQQEKMTNWESPRKCHPPPIFSPFRLFETEFFISAPVLIQTSGRQHPNFWTIPPASSESAETWRGTRNDLTLLLLTSPERFFFFIPCRISSFKFYSVHLIIFPPLRYFCTLSDPLATLLDGRLQTQICHRD